MRLAHLAMMGLTIAAPMAAALPAIAQSSPVAGESGWGAVIKPKPSKSRPETKPPGPQEVTGPLATAAAMSGDATRTRLAFDLSAPVGFTVFRMTNPFRVVLDLDALEFRLPPETGRDGRALISAFRYGLFAPGKSRIVIDTAGPTRIDTARIVSIPTGARLEVELVPTTPTEIAAAELASAAQSIDLKPET